MILPDIQCFQWLAWLVVFFREVISGASPDLCRCFPTCFWRGLLGPTCLLESVLCKESQRHFWSLWLRALGGQAILGLRNHIQTLNSCSRVRPCSFRLVNRFGRSIIKSFTILFSEETGLCRILDWSGGYRPTAVKRLALFSDQSDQWVVRGWVAILSDSQLLRGSWGGTAPQCGEPSDIYILEESFGLSHMIACLFCISSAFLLSLDESVKQVQ